MLQARGGFDLNAFAGCEHWFDQFAFDLTHDAVVKVIRPAVRLSGVLGGRVRR